MVEEILQWLKNISIFLIFMTTVLNLIPEKEDKKPVQFFLGIVMVLIFFQPVLKAGGLEQKMAQYARPSDAGRGGSSNGKCTDSCRKL